MRISDWSSDVCSSDLMPIILNRRQAGPAIEGALRHEQVELTRLAVDTHGHTHFAMALAKLVGFDLCPRLAGLSTRKLYLPRGLFATDIGAFTSCYEIGRAHV